MTKLSTLIAASLLGISSVAAAQPAIEPNGSASVHVTLGSGNASASAGTVYVHDYRAPSVFRPSAWTNVYFRPDPRPYPAPAPVIVPTSPWQVLGSVGTGTKTLTSTALSANRFDTLKLDVEGRVKLDKIAIVFGDDQVQVIEYDRVLTDSATMPLIDLTARNRKIDHIVFYSQATSGGYIRVLGRRDAHPSAPNPAPPPATAWTRLGTLSSGTQSLSFDEPARYDLLKLQFQGKVHLNQVRIIFGNGEEQLVRYNKDLTGSTTIDLALADRRISQVIVSTTQQLHGEVALFAK